MQSCQTGKQFHTQNKQALARVQESDKRHSIATACTCLEIARPDLHLGAFGGVVVAFPGLPVHAVSERRVVTVVVLAVQVGFVALVVPPGTFAHAGAAPPIILVVVSVFGAEGHAVVPRERVPRSSCKRNAQPQYHTKPSRVHYSCSPQSTELNKSLQCARNNGTWGRATGGVQHSDINHFTPEYILPTFQRETVSMT